MDGRKSNRGTVGNKGGRPPKADEQKLIERLSPLDDTAFNALKNGLDENEPWAVKLFFEYRYGKPKQQVDHTTNGESLNRIEMTQQQVDKLIEKL
jgi:hypothetical protein